MDTMHFRAIRLLPSSSFPTEINFKSHPFEAIMVRIRTIEDIGL